MGRRVHTVVGRLAAGTLFERLPQEVPPVPRWEINQLPEDLIPKTLVERERLEAERVEECGAAPSHHGLPLRRRHEFPAVAAPAQRILHPQGVNVQPAPVDLRQEATHDLAAGVAEEDSEARITGVTGLRPVVANEAVDYFAPLFFTKLTLYCNREFVHM